MGCAADWEFFPKTLILSAPGSVSCPRPKVHLRNVVGFPPLKVIKESHFSVFKDQVCAFAVRPGSLVKKNRLRKIKSKKTGHKGNFLIM